MFFEKVLDYVYPNVCGICEKKIKSNSYTCENCTSVLKYYKEKIIFNNINKNYDILICLYEYKGVIKKQICNFKFNNKKYIGKTFAKLISEKILELNLNFDIIIPVPISFKRYIERGYNQCAEITKTISKLLNKKALNNVLIKVKNNNRQSKLNKEARKENVIGAYKVKNNLKIKNKTILLVDDICTTGSTLNECSKVLKKMGVSKIIAITIAYA